MSGIIKTKRQIEFQSLIQRITGYNIIYPNALTIIEYLPESIS